MSKVSKALIAAAGNSGGAGLAVEDVFSTYLYTGTGADQTITNGIDLDGEGGLVWVKGRDTTYDHRLFDTERGVGEMLSSNNTGAEQTLTEQLEAFNSDGFQVGTNLGINGSTKTYASWTFRKAEKFFDVVTYTGDGVAGRTVAHNLGSTPAFIIVKQTDGSNGWPIYHTSYGATYVQFLNDYTSAFTNTDYWNDTAPTDAVFSVGTNSRVNASGSSYVAYVFASDAGGYGDDGSENVIKCSSFTTDGSKNASVDCGFEPQWLLVKKRTTSSDWFLFDAMRGMPVGVNPNTLYPNQSNAESTGQATYVSPTAIGFDVSGADWEASAEYIYIAIRRPMKTPESGTEVFAVDLQGSTSPTPPTFYSGFPIDAMIYSDRDGTYVGETYSRLTGDSKKLLTHSSAAEASAGGSNYSFDRMDGSGTNTLSDTTRLMWMFKRATGFFDVVAYTGDGLDGRTVDHNLKAVPELLIVKSRSSAYTWRVLYCNGATGLRLNLNDNSAATTATGSIWGNSSTFIPPTSTQFTVSNYSNVNLNNATFIAYLFASVAGVSKVGSYTGNGGSSVQQIDCGFSSGARFILIKDADGTNDWYVWDSARGIVAGNDPYLRLNQTAAENPDYDWVDPYSAGFEVTTDATAAFRINVSGRKYIFLAIA